MLAGSQKHLSSRGMYGCLRGSGSLRGAFLGSDVIFAQRVSVCSFPILVRIISLDPPLIPGFASDDIWNVRETGLFWKD